MKYFPTAEGYVQKTLSVYSYVYNYTDHLGNIRMSYAEDPENPGMLKIIEENHYYPFGLKHARYNSTELEFAGRQGSVVLRAKAAPSNPAPVLGYAYKYNGKELQGELGLNIYNFGFRNYDSAIGRWFNIDPLAELAPDRTPYHFVSNNPINRIDLLGLTDYTLNKKTGAVTQVGEANDEPDRILQTNSKGEVEYNRKGEAKVAVDNIEKNILQDGQNFKDDNNVFAVGSNGQPTREGVEKFALQLSDYVGKEIGGAYFSKDNVKDITHMTIGGYENNTYTRNKNNGSGAIRKISSTLEEFKNYHIRGFLHTHPNEASRFESSKADRDTKNQALKQNPNLFFLILTHPKDYSGKYPTIINYTNH